MMPLHLIRIDSAFLAALRYPCMIRQIKTSYLTGITFVFLTAVILQLFQSGCGILECFFDVDLILRFSATPNEIPLGGSSVLEWEAIGTKCYIEPDIGRVELSGRLGIAPRQTTTYVLTCIAEEEVDFSDEDDWDCPVPDDKDSVSATVKVF